MHARTERCTVFQDRCKCRASPTKKRTRRSDVRWASTRAKSYFQLPMQQVSLVDSPRRQISQGHKLVRPASRTPAWWIKSPARRCRRETLQSMPSPQQQYEFRGGFGGRAASSAAPMNRTREPCRRRADYSSVRRRSARKRVRPT